MSNQEPGLEQATQLVRRLSTEAVRVARRTRKRRLFQRFVKTVLWMLFTTFVVIPGMIAGGFLFGPRGVEGLIAAPALLFAMWAAIIYWYFGRKIKPRKIVKANLALLPAQVGEWLEEERGRLPEVAQNRLDSLGARLDALIPQLQTLDAQTPDAQELRRLLGEELPELVRGYAKVPLAFRQQPLHGGKTPERQLTEGLETIEQQLDQVHARLAAGDLQALATHERYLELKYNRKGKID